MTTEELNTQLYEKMFEEQEQYREWLLSQPPEEILNHTYSYTMREDILMSIEMEDLPELQVRALLNSTSPLEDVFRELDKTETNHMDDIRAVIENRANYVLQEYPSTVPLYSETLEYALDNDEFDQWKASHKANMSCKNAIEEAIREGFDGFYLADNAAKKVLSKFGPERVSHVLAVTLRSHSHDLRYSAVNQAWAATIPAFETEKNHVDYAITSHPAVLNGFVTQVRHELAAELANPVKQKDRNAR